jgi:hypothetical protein
MTIPDVGRCLGSGNPPLEGSEEKDDGRSTGVCSTCSGRFELVHGGVLAEHETASDEDREDSRPEQTSG